MSACFSADLGTGGMIANVTHYFKLVAVLLEPINPFCSIPPIFFDLKQEEISQDYFPPNSFSVYLHNYCVHL